MTTSIHPLQTTNLIRDTYLRYLKTIYPFQDQVLRTEFWQALEIPELLVKGPLLEASPPFEPGRSIAQLIDAGVLHRGFCRLCSDALPLTRPLYLHQEQGITKVVGENRNLVVATGTGSGKTETFLVPILDHLLREQAARKLARPGVRALLLYPMNALANDQLKRLRRVLADYPQITFGRYTGETEEEPEKAEDAFRSQFPREPRLPNELISREALRAAPPHILLTNYAMLEYLLLRPSDSEFFDGGTGKHWRFIVIDEAHVYDGASGIEIAMLLRRLKDRVVRSEPNRLRCIATSATLGRGREDFQTVAKFASEIFGEPFEWADDDPARQNVVEATRLPMVAMSQPWGEAASSLYGALRDALPTATVPTLATIALEHGVPPTVVQAARRDIGLQEGPAAVDRFLHLVLSGDARLHTLQNKLAETPYFLSALADELFPGEAEAAQRLVEVVDLAARAKPAPQSLSLLPARYHVFARALEGAFACLNAGAPEHTEQHLPRLFLTRHESCPHCGAAVFELATCVRCGATYIIGRLGQLDEDSGDKKAWRPLQQLTGSFTGGRELAYFLMSDAVAGGDEDEVVAAEEDLDALDSEKDDPYILCTACGMVAPGARVSSVCRCEKPGTKLVIQRVDLQDKPQLNHCVACGARSPSGIIYRFLTGQDAPVSVLATALYQTLPPSEDEEMEDLPGQGRKLLAFSDSRQDAAFFAPYLERTYRQVLRRRLILKAVLEDEAGREGRLRVQDVSRRLLRQAEGIGLFTQRQSYDERMQNMNTWLMQELVAWDRRISFEGLGLLQFRLVQPTRWRPPAPLVSAPWNLTEDEAWQIIELLVDTLRQHSAVTFPENVDPRSEAFAPRNRLGWMREKSADSKNGVYSWVPTRGSNRRYDILDRLLTRISPALSDQERQHIVLETLSGIWRHLTDTGSVWREHLPSETLKKVGIVYRVDYHFYELVPQVEGTQALYECDRCHSTTYSNVKGVCPAYHCHGNLVLVDREREDWEHNHYRYLYQSLVPVPLEAEEHTAQWKSDEAAKIQDRFIRGEVNALSCSTTFELGVDVGELQAVLMRNVPPTTANYVQRAGRAGRRTDSAAFALTYAQRRSHDLSHYAHPEKLVAGRIKPPVVTMTNEKIVRRHAQSVFFAAFFRWAKQEWDKDLNVVTQFFDGTGPGSGTQLLSEYAATRPREVREALERIIPAGLQDELGVADWSWLPVLWNDEGEGLLNKVNKEVTEELDILRRLAHEAAGKCTMAGYDRAKHYQGIISTIQRRSLLGFLGSRNVLPKYGFPTDVVDLRTEYVEIPEARRVELQRDLRMAVSEYAPGGEVVAAKHVWVSGGIYKQSGREWPTFNYAVCPECGRFHRSIEPIEGPCTVCGANLYDWRRLYGTFIIPEFGFIARREVRASGEARPQRIYSSRAYFAEYATPESADEQPVLEPVLDLSSATAQVWQRYSRYGKLAIVNSGINHRGFRVCSLCGFAEPAPEQPTGKRRSKKPEPHKNPRTGKDCGGYTQNWHLGHEFLTDVLEFRMEGLLAASGDYDLWLSVLYALLEGASEALGIRRDDLDGTLYPYTTGLAPALLLYDNVPGGAGHVRRVATELPDVFRAAYNRVKSCECGEETSCYECLRNYRNQYFHDQLRRGLARDFLFGLLTASGQLPR
ncbi:MAG: DEAD/DEAH box helicase [Anaerolineae bacterium]|nr:DEAD/DEAH box helicase [Anaerolineae bacterium]